MEKTPEKPVENAFKNCEDNFKSVPKIIKKYKKNQNILDSRKKSEII